jgi:IclR helix-turn-helix domain
MSKSVSLTLTDEQVAMVIADVAACVGGSDSDSLLVAMSREMASSSLAEDRTVSMSLLRGLRIFSCIPADGSERGITEIAHELREPASTVARYAHTLALLGLVEQNPQTHKYYRVPASA